MSHLLEGVDRQRLDFDFEKVCSVTLSQSNVYVCLSCGRLLQGRTINTPAHQHSLSSEHPLYMNLDSRRAYHLPENVEFDDGRALDDVRYSIFPTFTPEALVYLERQPIEAVDLHGRAFIAGFLGMNNIKANDYANVVLQLLLHLPPLRDLCLSHDFRSSPSPLWRTLSEAGRKVWNPRAFKAILSPHEFLQAVSIASERKFSLNKSADALEFLTWLLNILEHHAKSFHQLSIIGDTLRGQVQVSSKKVALGAVSLAPSFFLDSSFDSKSMPFLYLTLDLPPTPLYQSITGEYTIPQVDIKSLLEKYDGGRLTQRGESLQAFLLQSLPPYLILSYRRITRSHLVWQKNQTLVNYSVEGLEVVDAERRASTYDLLANICHKGEAEPGKGHYIIHLLNASSGRWYEIDDLHVKEIPAVNVSLGDCYIQLWRRRS